MRGHQNIEPRPLSSVALHDSATLHGHLAASHGFIILHDNSVPLHKLVNQTSQTLTVWWKGMTKTNIFTIKKLLWAASSGLHNHVTLTPKEI